MAIDILVRITSNDMYCSRKVDMRGNSMEICIDGSVDEKRRHNKFPTTSNFCEQRKRHAYFHNAYQHPRAREENVLFDQNHIARQNGKLGCW